MTLTPSMSGHRGRLAAAVAALCVFLAAQPGSAGPVRWNQRLDGRKDSGTGLNSVSLDLVPLGDGPTTTTRIQISLGPLASASTSGAMAAASVIVALQSASVAATSSSFLVEGPVPTVTYSTTASAGLSAPYLLANASSTSPSSAISGTPQAAAGHVSISVSVSVLTTTVTVVPPASEPPQSHAAASSGLLSSPASSPESSRHLSTPVSSMAKPPPLSPTGHVNPLVPTLNTPLASSPTATLSDSALAANVAKARALNTIFAGLTPLSACQGAQVACVQGQVARCVGTAFVLEPACPEGRRCLAMPMSHVAGAWIGCVYASEAGKVLGNGQAAPTTPTLQTRVAAERPVVTMTTIVTVVDDAPAAQTPPSYAPESAPSAPVPRPAQLAASSSSLSASPAVESIHQPSPSLPADTSSLLLQPVGATALTPDALTPDSPSRYTLTVNGTPTVSVFYTVTVTEKERQTVTLIVPAS